MGISTKIDLCSAALISLGAAGISSFDEGSAESILAASLYDVTYEGLLSNHPWGFAKKTSQLALLNKTPIANYNYAHQLPSDFMRAISLGDAGHGVTRGLDYQIIGRQLHSNKTSVMLQYIFKPNEQDLPAWFKKCLIDHLAAEFCLPLLENTSRANLLSNRAQLELAHAKSIDSQQKPPNNKTAFQAGFLPPNWRQEPRLKLIMRGQNGLIMCFACQRAG